MRGWWWGACLLAALTGCGSDEARDDAGAPAAAGRVEALPHPERPRGSVTGMPPARAPGAPGAPVAVAPTDATAVAEDGTAVPAEADAGSGPGAVTAANTGDALALLQEYYARIGRGDFVQAAALWANGGTAAAPPEFAGGLAEAVRVQAQPGAPTTAAGTPGAPFVEIPVEILVEYRDGSTRHYRGRYLLRHMPADGTSAGPHAWRIASASLRPAS